MRVSPSRGRIFGAPAIIGALTLTGLLAGLTWSGGGRYLSWVGVGSPVAVAAWIWLRIRLGHRGGVTSPARYRRG